MGDGLSWAVIPHLAIGAGRVLSPARRLLPNHNRRIVYVLRGQDWKQRFNQVEG